VRGNSRGGTYAADFEGIDWMHVPTKLRVRYFIKTIIRAKGGSRDSCSLKNGKWNFRGWDRSIVLILNKWPGEGVLKGEEKGVR